MQRRQVIVGNIVHRHVVLQQELHTVQVVPLGGHVQRWQAVLRGVGEKTEEERGGDGEVETKRERRTDTGRQTDRQVDRHTQGVRTQPYAVWIKLWRRLLLQKHCYNEVITTMSMLLHWLSCAVKLQGYAARTGCSGEVAQTLWRQCDNNTATVLLSDWTEDSKSLCVIRGTV